MYRFIATFVLLVSINVGHAQDTTRLSLLFLGDIMQHGSQISAAYQASTQQYDYTSCFQYVKPYIRAADLAIGNLEVTLAGKPYSGYPQFSAPDELVKTLKDVGMDVLVTANNHCVDKGRKGLERTIALLDSAHLQHTGTFVDQADRKGHYPLIVWKKGFKLAVLNYTFSTNGLPVASPNIVNRIDTAVIHKDIIAAKAAKPDAIIVFTHWGIEYQSLPAPDQKRVTEFCFKQGADLVIGAHPHVIQPMEWRKDQNKLIAYSLGNFVSGQRKRYTDGGTMLEVELMKVGYKKDSAVTTINDARYRLQWIYKSNGGKYYIIPTAAFEKDSLGVIADASKESFKTFVNDSRSLFGKYNVAVPEAQNVPVSYRLDVTSVMSDTTWQGALPFDTKVIKDGTSVYVGDFYNAEDAEVFKSAMWGSKELPVLRIESGKITPLSGGR